MKIQGLSKQLPIFSLQEYRSVRQSPVQNGVLVIDNQLIIVVPLPSQDGVSGIHKMTRYKDGGFLDEFFLTV
jgi:hypothetical protein